MVETRHKLVSGSNTGKRPTTLRCCCYAWICSEDTYEVCHVAINLPAQQSSVYMYLPANLANDGIRRTTLIYHSCAHSANETNPWWVVDLGIPLTVTRVLFTNRRSSGMCPSTPARKSEEHCKFPQRVRGDVSDNCEFMVHFGT